MKNLINGGYKGEIYPINPSADEIMGPQGVQERQGRARQDRRRGVRDSRQVRRRALIEVGEKKIPGAVLIPSGFAETGNMAGQEELVEIGRKYDVRLMGPNIYGFYYTPKNLCATFCTAYDVKGQARAVVAVGRHRHGDHRLLALGQDGRVRDRRAWATSRDIDEDDLLTFFEQDDNTKIIAQHCEDLKDGRAFAEVAKRVSKKKPVVMLKAGRTSHGRARGQLAHRRARRQRQDLRGRAAGSRA